MEGKSRLRGMMLGWLMLPLLASAEWRIEYFGDTAFMKSHGTAVKPDKMDFPIANGFKWNGRRRGWSFVAEGVAEFPAAGKYRFKPVVGSSDTGAYRIHINGMDVDRYPDGVELKAGKARVSLYARHRKPERSMQERTQFELTFAAPGADEFKPLALTAPEKLEVGYPAGFGEEFNLAKGEHRDYSSRSFEFEVKEPGMYELACKITGVPRYLRLWLNDLQVGFLNGTRRGVDNDAAFTGYQDRTGRRDVQRLDFFGKLRSVRWLEKGTHRFDVYAHWGPWFWDDEMDKIAEEGRCRLGVTRLDGANAETDTGFWFENNDSMVFEANRPMRLRVQSASAEARDYVMEVRDNNGAAVWKRAFKVDNRKQYVEYPCDREGAFEYVIKNARGEVVEGPWAFVVVDATPVAVPKMKPGASNEAGKVRVDRVECTEPAGGEHDFRDSGTSTLVETEHGTYRQTGTKGFTIDKNKYVKLSEKGKATGFRLAKPGETGDMHSGAYCDWFAYTLKVKNPNRPHLVTLTVPNDVVRYISAAAYDRQTGAYNAWNIQAGEAPAAGPWSKMSIFAWPHTDALDVLVFCSNGNHNSPLNRQSAVKDIELWEFPEGAPALAESALGWNNPVEYGWQGEQVDLGVNERTMPPLWNDPNKMIEENSQMGQIFYNWNAFFHAWKRFGETSAYHGNNLCIFPVYSYCMLTFQGKAMRMLPCGADRYASDSSLSEVVDPFDRDLFMLMLLQGSKYNVKIVADFMIQRVDEPVVECWAKYWGEDPQGMLLSANAQGKAYRSFSNATFVNPAHPAVRKQLVGFTREFAKRYGKYPAFGGMRTRFWPEWPSGFEGWFFNADLGCDDWTVALFSKETGIKVDLVNGDEIKFAERKKRLYGELRTQWLDWRAKKCLSLREEMLAELRKYAPQARLYMYKKDRPEGCGLDPKYFAGRKDLGWDDNEVEIKGPDVEWNRTDPLAFRNFNRRPAPYGTPAIEEWGGHRIGAYPQGVCCNSAYRVSPYHLEPAALALADGKLDSLLAGGQWCIPPADEELRSFVQAWRTIPQGQAENFALPGGRESPVILNSIVRRKGWFGKERVFWLINRTDSTRDVVIRFGGDAGEITDAVDGSSVGGGSGVTVAVKPYQVRVFRAEKAAKFAAVDIPLREDELKIIRQGFAFLDAMARRAGKYSHTRIAAGEKYSTLENSGPHAFYDVTETFADIMKPIREAYAQGMMHEVRRLIIRFRTFHTWWMEAFGWPADYCKPRKVGRQNLHCFMKDPREISSKTELTDRNYIRFPEFPSAADLFVAMPRETPLHIHQHGSAGHKVQLELQAYFGGGYGSIRVEDMNGKVLGRIEADASAPLRYETRVMPDAIRKLSNGLDIKLIGEGPKGMAIHRLGLENLRGKVINAIQVIGPFDRFAGREHEAPAPTRGQFVATAKGLEHELPVEREAFDPAKTYDGLYGAKLQWKKVDLGERKLFDMLSLCPYDMSSGRGCGYGVFWVKAEKGCTVDLSYSVEFFFKLWVNDRLVQDVTGGPTRVYRSRECGLRKGWNKIMFKTGCGSCAWHLSLLMSDANNLEFSAEPPPPEKK